MSFSRRKSPRFNRGRSVTYGSSAPSGTVTETIVDTYTSGTSWTSPELPATQTVTGEVWAGGAGGLQDTAAGDGGDYARAETLVDGDTAYPYAVGAGGLAGGAAGGDSTWNTSDAVAAGGGSATTTSGDQTYAGAAGAVGTGNRAGGGGAGSAADAAGVIGGGPDGGFCTVGVTRAFVPGAGGSSQTSAQHAGAQGLFRVTFTRETAAGWAYPVGWAFGRDSTNVSARNVVIPAGDVGDLLICEFATDGAPTVTMTGWNNIIDHNSTNNALSIWWRTADGADPVEIGTSVIEAGAWVVTRLKDAGTPQATATGNTSGVADPPLHSASGGSGRYLAIAVASHDVLLAYTPAWPAGYENRLVVAPVSAGGVGLLSAIKKITASSEDPGAFVTPDEEWCAATVLVPYAA